MALPKLSNISHFHKTHQESYEVYTYPLPKLDPVRILWLHSPSRLLLLWKPNCVCLRMYLLSWPILTAHFHIIRSGWRQNLWETLAAGPYSITKIYKKVKNLPISSQYSWFQRLLSTYIGSKHMSVEHHFFIYIYCSV